MRRDENERQRLMSSGFPSVKMEVDEVPNIVEEQPLVFNEGEQQRIDEEAERERLKIEQELREMQQRMLLEEEQRRREQERREMERRQMEMELEEQRKLEALKEEERLRMLEEQAKRVREEEKRLVEAAEQERRERLRAEEEEALKRLNISSQAELQNRHLLNVSMNVSISSHTHEIWLGLSNAVDVVQFLRSAVRPRQAQRCPSTATLILWCSGVAQPVCDIHATNKSIFADTGPHREFIGESWFFV